ncbi:glycoside hydrolase family 3 C-terminal domain-containing protein [Flavobacterium sp. 123]|uniref:glycoside hydrolase family 3 C-terminal domain-containing protein n=1 Tax=Flavobacterium sp. 123 TaxID=2135627 RepID=UPI000F1598D7|nr:glycoside hydrolase family 3 C-terminal domain-containing protein [Flavobacterium sp. 123]RKS99883.1 beta-glucosidase [Flavobacterium sp. 123]
MKKIILLLIGVALSSQSYAQSVDYREKATKLVAKMTLEEKASLCSGETAWSTKAIARLGIPSIFMTDGPHGLRKAVGFDFTNSVPATCFPTASAVASSWNPALAQKMGEALGIESQANDVQILLGPGVNMKRSPLGGRNFEYFSEDPILAGTIATGYINGVQSQGVGTSIKHFAANSQETERMSNSSNVDERTLNEIYFPAFEMAVKNAQPWTVMCSYNKLNGVYASENGYLLTQTLKDKWGLKGFVVSDWGAVNERVAGVDAGLNLEMPASGGFNDKKIVEAVKKGTLSEARLDQIVTELLAVTLKAKDSHKKGIVVDKVKNNELARQVSGECIVLLKNDNAILPLKSSLKKIAIVGDFAKNPRYQGAGSSQVRPTQILNALTELQKLAKGTEFSFSSGYNTAGETDEAKIAEAVQNAKNAELVILFAGLPDSYESEGYDRANLDMPAGHNKLIAEVAKVNKNVVVVLMNGAAVSMPWKNDVSAIVEAYLGGQAGGGAIADILTGKVNPSGKLSETFPARVEDTPAAIDFPSRDGNANYGEGIFIGYRYYDKKKIEPIFPFGYGLSYTTFGYSDINTNTTSAKDSDDITISVKVKNTGKIAGKEVVQLYVHEQETEIARPENELKHFEKVSLLPGEEKTVSFKLTSRDFAYYNAKSHDWVVKSGKFDVLVGSSSRNLSLKQTIDIQSTRPAKVVLTRESLFKEFKKAPNSEAIYAQIVQSFTGATKKAETEDEKKAAAFLEAMLADMPINKFLLLSGGKFTEENLDAILKAVNQN